MRSELLIDLIHEFWTDSDEHLEIKRKQLSQITKEYASKYPAILREFELLNLNRIHADLLCIYMFYPHYQKYFGGIPFEYENRTLGVISDTVGQERQLKRILFGVDRVRFVFAHRTAVDFVHDVFSHYYQRYTPADSLLIKWLVINRHFAAPKGWYNPVVRSLLRYQERSLASLSDKEFRQVVGIEEEDRSFESQVVRLEEICSLPSDPLAPDPRKTWEFVKPVPDLVQDALAKEMGLPIVDLATEMVDITTFKSFPLYYLKKHRIIPLRIDRHHLVVAAVDPRIPEELEELKQTSQHTIKLKIIREQDFYIVFSNLVDNFLKF